MLAEKAAPYLHAKMAPRAEGVRQGAFFVLIARNLIGAGANGERQHPERVRTL